MLFEPHPFSVVLVGRSALQVNSAVRGQIVTVLVTTSVTMTSSSHERAVRKWTGRTAAKYLNDLIAKGQEKERLIK